MSKTKATGSKASQHVSPVGKRLGLKVSSGENVSAGEILIRQRGTTFSAGKGVKAGRDHTLYAGVGGKVKVIKKLGKKTIAVLPTN